MIALPYYCGTDPLRQNDLILFVLFILELI